jgi:hypothetical protein
VIIHGIEEHDLWAALEVVNYAYKGNLCFREEPATLSSPQSSRVRLSVKDPEGPGYRRWVYRSWWERAWWDQKRQGRHIRAACYHAYRDFLYAAFERSPHVRVITALAVYEGFRNFESTYRRTGKLNVGSYFEPVRFEDCCDCLKKFPQIEEMLPEASLSEYALEPDRSIYSGLNLGEKRR